MPESEDTHHRRGDLLWFTEDLAAALKCRHCLSGFTFAPLQECAYCGRNSVQDVKPDNKGCAKVGPPPIPYWGVAADIPAAPAVKTTDIKAVATQSTELLPLVTQKRATRGRPPQVPRDSCLARPQAYCRTIISRRSGEGHRGRPPSGTRQGAQHGFKGVRTRKGVRGFLVEIRPPKWKKTIWLGTYNTSAEAAGAYDAGVFYTKKPNSKFNFSFSEGAFPPLPPHLQLDKEEHAEEIKNFVQKQAQVAAVKVKTLSTAVQCSRDEIVDMKPPPSNIAASSRLTDEPVADEVNQGLLDVDTVLQQIPMDLEYVMNTSHFMSPAAETLQNEMYEYESSNLMYAEYAEYQHGWSIPSFELKQEEPAQAI